MSAYGGAMAADGFGALLRECRRAVGLSQRDVAERAGVSVAALRDLEQGRTRRPHPRSVSALIAAVGGTGDTAAALWESARDRRDAGPARPATAARDRLRISALGPLILRRGAAELPLAGKRRVLAGRLALSPGTAVPVAELVDLLWPDRVPRSPAGAMQAHLSRLRRQLTVATADPGGGTLDQISDGYRLTVSDEELDVLRFRRAATDARWLMEARPAEALEVLDGALRLWRGAPCADVEELRHHPLATALTEERIAAALLHADVAGGLRQHGRSLPHLRALVDDHPLHEPLHARLIVALCATGLQAQAVTAYEGIRRRLAGELGIDPGAQLADAHRRLLHQQVPSSDARVTVAPAAPAAPRPAQLPPDVRGFVGRRDLLDRLAHLADPGAGGSPAQVAVLCGPAGVGKTASAVHLARRIRARFPDGQLYANLRGFDPGREPAGAAEVLRDFLGALGVAPRDVPAGLDAGTALYRSLLDGRRILVLLDNVRDAEHARPLLPAGHGCLTLVTSRHDLTGLVAADGAVPFRLGLLTLDEGRELLGRRLGPGRLRSEAAAGDRIIELCTGLPLALVVLAARAAADPQVPLARLAAHLADTAAPLDELTSGDAATDVRSVFRCSYQVLSPSAARLFRLLSLHPGPDVSTTAAASLAGVPVSEVRGPLAELARAHLTDVPAPGRSAVHDLLRAYATELSATLDSEADLRAARHRLLDHFQGTAHAAAQLLTPRRGAVQPPPAAPGTTIEQLTDHGQALAWFTAEHRSLLAMLELAERSGMDGHVWRIASAMEYYLQRGGAWWALVDTHAAAWEAARRLGDRAAQARIGRGLARGYTWLGRYEEAHARLTACLPICEESRDDAERGHTHLDLSFLQERQGRYEQAARHAEQAQHAFAAAGDRAGEAGALNMRGWCHAQFSDLRAARTLCDSALRIFRAMGDRARQANTADSLGFIHHRLGEWPAAVGYYRQSLALFQAAGDQYGAAQALTHLGDVHNDGGQEPAARAAWRRALAILEVLEHRDADAVRARLRAANEAPAHP